VKLARFLFVGLIGLVAICLVVFPVLHQDRLITTDVWIDRQPQDVWKILADTGDYPAWNPTISRFDGELREGNTIEMVEGTGKDAIVFHPTLLTVHPDHELRWKGYVWSPGIFDGEHRFVLEASGNRTHLVQSEQFTGLLAGKMTESIIEKTARDMKTMNDALKIRVESIGKP
jgi:hypothetical protein